MQQTQIAGAVAALVHRLLRIFLAIVLLVFLFNAASLDETRFLEIDTLLTKHGAELALVESVLTLCVAAALLYSIQFEKRKKVWIAGGIFMLIALTANLADYFGTLQASPDLALEVSPIWNGLIADTSFEFARIFAFCGKVFVSLLAGASFIFYLQNIEKLAPLKPCSPETLVFHLGERCSNFEKQWLPFVTVLSFYFAAINLFCFYIAYANSLVNNLPVLSLLPPLPGAVGAALALITAAFVITTHKILNLSTRHPATPAPIATVANVK